MGSGALARSPALARAAPRPLRQACRRARDPGLSARERGAWARGTRASARWCAAARRRPHRTLHEAKGWCELDSGGPPVRGADYNVLRSAPPRQRRGVPGIAAGRAPFRAVQGRGARRSPADARQQSCGVSATFARKRSKYRSPKWSYERGSAARAAIPSRSRAEMSRQGRRVRHSPAEAARGGTRARGELRRAVTRRAGWGGAPRLRRITRGSRGQMFGRREGRASARLARTHGSRSEARFHRLRETLRSGTAPGRQ